MRNKRDIYCDYQFWEAFYDMEDQVLHDRSRRKRWDAFNDFLSSNNIYFNVSKEKIDEESKGGQNLSEISKARGGAGIKFLDVAFPQIETMSDVDNNLLNAIFLTVLDDSECKRLSLRFGIIIFNLSMIFSAEHVYKDNGISFYRANGQNWSFLKALNREHPGLNCCNSLIITDRYLLYDQNENAIETNLKPILEAFLPQTIDNGIFCTICIFAEYKAECCCPIEDKLKKLELLIKALRPNLKFKLNIFHSWLHDRSILTNNVILTSGAGFDVIGENEVALKFTTTSLCFPFLYNQSDSSIYLDWISNVLKIKRKSNNYNIDYWGEEEKKNHLLDYYDAPTQFKTKRGPMSGPISFVAGRVAVVNYNSRFVAGTFRKGEPGSNDMIIQQQNGFKQEVRSIREGESISDGDLVEYKLCRELQGNRKIYYAEDVHIKR